MRSLSDEEAWARDCIGEALPGCTVDQHDDGSEPGMYDLTITYPDGHLGAVEVTAAVDAQPGAVEAGQAPGEAVDRASTCRRLACTRAAISAGE